jgi:hypothetical protein
MMQHEQQRRKTMANGKQRQALAVSSRLSSQLALPGVPGRAVEALETEAARIVAEDAERRLNGGASLHLVISEGRVSGFVKDAHTTARFGGGAVAVTTHD